MESLGRIGETLPPDELAEKELQAAFRGAALSLTGLFKIGKKASKKGKHLVQSLYWRCGSHGRRGRFHTTLLSPDQQLTPSHPTRSLLSREA